MKWLKFFVILLQLALTILKRLERQRILQEGQVRTIKHLLEKANALAKNAQVARDAVSDEPSDILRDKFNRDAPDKDSGV
jgi:hypothetical protein